MLYTEDFNTRHYYYYTYFTVNTEGLEATRVMSGFCKSGHIMEKRVLNLHILHQNNMYSCMASVLTPLKSVTKQDRHLHNDIKTAS